MTCTSSTFCSGWRPEGTSEAACLVLLGESADDSVVLCDVEIEGGPSHPPPGPAPPSGDANNKPSWALWKTMAIIWSIIGFAALLVAVVLLSHWLLRRRALAASSSPVTALSADDRRRIEQVAYAAGEMPPAASGSGGGGGADATVTLMHTAPDGKPILAYGAVYPPPPLMSPPSPVLTSPSPSALAAAMLATATAGGTRLPPTAGDAILRAAADSRAAYNGPPMRAPAAVIPPFTGITPPLPPAPPPPPLAEAAFPAPAPAPGGLSQGLRDRSASALAGTGPAETLPYNSFTPSAAELPLPLPPLPPPPPVAASAGLLGSEGQVAGVAGYEALPVVTPAALVPPPAATLQSPRASPSPRELIGPPGPPL
ncbi:hypothetical protein Vafri_19287 [Volvox africanus]|nr:hypothetical protein Vafri_19287 [Volvox africanus]